jgi:hypothetical protein
MIEFWQPLVYVGFGLPNAELASVSWGRMNLSHYSRLERMPERPVRVGIWHSLRRAAPRSIPSTGLRSSKEASMKVLQDSGRGMVRGITPHLFATLTVTRSKSCFTRRIGQVAPADIPLQWRGACAPPLNARALDRAQEPCMDFEM